MILKSSTILYGVPSVLVVLIMKALIVSHEVSSHLIWPLKEWLILNVLKNLVHWFLEHHVNHLSIGGSRLPNIISPRPIIIVLVWLEIPPLLRDNLSFPLPLLLVFLNPLIFINLVHELAYTDSRFPSQRFPQAMLGR